MAQTWLMQCTRLDGGIIHDAHTLNLIVKDSLKSVPEVVKLLEKCTAIVSFFHHSTQATEKLRATQQQLKVAEHKLIQSVATRWNSVFYMLQRLFEQKDTVSTALCLWGKNTLCLDEGEFSLIKQTVDSLQPFEEVTCKISAEKYVSVSKVIPLVSLIHRAVAECERQGSSLASQLAQQCQRRFRGIETIYCLAARTFLDVRFKHLGFRAKGNVEVVKKRLVSELQDVYQTEHAAPSLAPSSTATVNSTSSPSISGPSATEPTESPAPYGSGPSKGGIWTDFDTQVLSGQYHWSAISEVLIEVRRYPETRMHWFGTVKGGLLKGRRGSEQKGNRLKGKTVNMLLFLNKNL